MENKEISDRIRKGNLVVFWIPILSVILVAVILTFIFSQAWIFITLVVIDIALLFILRSYSHIINIKRVGLDNEKIYFESQIQKRNNSILQLLRRKPHSLEEINEKLIKEGFLLRHEETEYYTKVISCRIWSSDFFFMPFSNHMRMNIYIDPNPNNLVKVKEIQNEIVGNVCIFTSEIDIDAIISNLESTIVLCWDWC